MTASSWRAQLWDVLEAPLFPPSHKQSPSRMPLNLMVAQNSSYFEALALKFIEGPAKSLLKDGASAAGGPAHQDLVYVLKTSAQFAQMMWRQPFDIEFMGFQHFNGLKFSTDSAEVQTHPSQCRRRNRPQGDAVVDMVVQPSIVATLENGDRRVWGRAVVLWH